MLTWIIYREKLLQMAPIARLNSPGNYATDDLVMTSEQRDILLGMFGDNICMHTYINTFTYNIYNIYMHIYIHIYIIYTCIHTYTYI